jgi:hypothetical protein
MTHKFVCPMGSEHNLSGVVGIPTSPQLTESFASEDDDDPLG